jgi:predicted 2-oxoglutarate/Fe(II)-dependent dioxygenase YbiX
MFEICDDILTKDEITFLENECKSFIANDIPFEINGKKNYYFRKFIDESYIFSFYNTILNKFENKKHIKYVMRDTWINKINPESNQNDEYHNDVSDLTILIFLNEEFTGGEFEYIDNEKQIIKIKPQKNKAIIMDTTLYHRVLPVLSGERYTLVCFIESEKKEKKSLI